MKHARYCLLALFLWLAGGPGAICASADNGGLSINGFGTLGLARSDNMEVEYVRDLSQPNGITKNWSGKLDSVLGIQAGYRFNDQAEGVLQAITRYRYDGSYDPEVSWAFLRLEPSPNLSLRLGRLGTEFFMLADSRLVGYANLTVRPPPDFYDSLVFSYLDGIDIDATWPLGNDLLRAKLYAGVSPERTPFMENIPWNLKGSPIWGGHIDYTTDGWQFRVSHSRIRFDQELPFDTYTATNLGMPDFVANVPAMASEHTWSRYTAFGAVHENGPLQLQFMLNRIDHETQAYEDSKAGYLIASYRIGDFSPYLGYSRVKSKKSTHFDASSSPYQAVAAELVAQTHSDQHTTFLGVRWDIQPRIALKAQVDRINANSSSRFPFRESYSPAWNGNMTVYSLALDFVF
jgi:hypothetical protein